MNIYRKFLFIVCVIVFSGLFSSHAQSVVLYSDDFELGLGNWTNVSTGDNRDWTRDSAGTPSVGTGPSTGAASTYYVYLETSSGYAYNAGDTAILQGPSITGTGIHLIFQYHMYGANIGTLSVDVLSGGIWINDVWSISGQQHTSNTAAYTSADIDLSGYSVSRVRFRATAAGGYTGDMAIDNVQITSVPTGPTAPVFNNDPISKSDAKQNQVYNDSIAADATDANGDTLTFSKVSGPAWLNVASDGQLSGTPQASDVGANTFVVEVSDGSLTDSATLNITVTDNTAPTVLFTDNFESGMGNWANVTVGDNSNWSRDSAGTPSVGTGPSTGADGSAYYMYLETSSGAAYYAGDSAILLGPSLIDSNIHLAFKYHMYGANTGTLAVDVLSGGVWINAVWSISGQQHTSNTAAYTAVDVDLSSYAVSQIRFRATAAGGYTGDIAIDSVEITSHINNDQDADGVLDSVDQCPNTPADETADSNGCSPSQIDSDNDGVIDINDAFPSDPNEWVDTDGDGIGNNADTDDDADGVLDVNDAFPLDANESVDTDGDGTGNNADTDDDNDGVLDVNDVYPLISLGSLTDTDGDGIPNDCDAACVSLGMAADTDDDADGVLDVNDAFPLNPNETLDTDSDGTGNNADTDDDNDGVLDANDAYPLISLGSLTDTDGDGIPNDCNAACVSLGMAADSDDDSDGVSDAFDAFPLNPNESVDTDGDGTGNNADTDDDNDGVLDSNDAYPLISLGSLTDTDGDGIPNDCDVTCLALGMTEDNDDDNDGVSDADEVVNGTNPLLVDSDSDGWNDGIEVACASDGANSNSLPVDTDADQVCDFQDIDDDDNGLIEIFTIADLDSIRNHSDGTGLHGHSLGCTNCQGFELQNDLDFDENQDGVVDGNDHGGIYWNGGLGWMPIGYDWSGSYIASFTSTFEGNNHSIKNLTIHAQSDLGLGLFYYIDQGTIRNLNLHGTITKVSSIKYRGAGLLTSYVNSNSLISNIHVSGSVDTTYAEYTGGMIGTVSYGNTTKISNCSSSASVNGGNFTGGLIGGVLGSSQQFLMLVENSYATGNVTGQFVIGGLIGHARWIKVSKSFAAGDVTNISSSSYLSRADTGGLIGRFTHDGIVEMSYTTGDVTSPGYDVGGLLGYSEYVHLYDVHAHGNVSGDRYVGGLVGYSNSAFFDDVYVTGTITGTSWVGSFTGGPGYGYGAGMQYWNTDTTTTTQSFGTGLTTYQLQCATDNVTVCVGELTNPFTGWNATNWYFGSNSQYPSVKIDTDDDGLYNGQEDLNLNGQVDVGETDFLSSDTDNDSFNDSVDAFPLDPSQH